MAVAVTNITQVIGIASTSQAITVTSTGSGSTLILVIQTRSSVAAPTITGVTDNIGNTWTAIPGTSTVFGTGQGRHAWYYAPNATAGVTTITVTNDQATAVTALQFFEGTGLDALLPLDRVSQSNGNSTTAATGPTATTSTANELVIGAAAVHAGSGSVGDASGYTMQTQMQNAVVPVFTVRTGYQIPVTRATFSWSTTVTSGLWVATIVTFKSTYDRKLSILGVG